MWGILHAALDRKHERLSACLHVWCLAALFSFQHLLSSPHLLRIQRVDVTTKTRAANTKRAFWEVQLSITGSVFQTDQRSSVNGFHLICSWMLLLDVVSNHACFFSFRVLYLAIQHSSPSLAWNCPYCLLVLPKPASLPSIVCCWCFFSHYAPHFKLGIKQKLSLPCHQL